MSGFNLSALAIRERSVTLFLIIAISIAGVLAFLKLGRAEDPAFTIKQMTVVTAWPGATAQEMQDLVAEPLEKRMQELRWYDRTETYTRPGLAFMTVILSDSTPPADVPEEFYQARKKLGDEARHLPTGVIGPFVNDEYSDVTFALYALKAQGDAAARCSSGTRKALRQRLLHVPGVKKVNIMGEQPERIFVEFSYERLGDLGVAPQDIFAALNSQNAVTPAGSIDTKGRKFHPPGRRYRRSAEDRGHADRRGRPNLKLSDVADVEARLRGSGHLPDPQQRRARTCCWASSCSDGWNGLDLGKALEAEGRQAQRGTAARDELTKVTDQAVNIRDAVDEFMLKFFVALAS